MKPLLVDGSTWHRRLGGQRNEFRYKVDYVLVEPEKPGPLPRLFSHNSPNLMSLHDRDHGGGLRKGKGAAWAREILSQMGADEAGNWTLLLLAQPRILGTRFTPVSFWFALDQDGQLRAAIAEVNNTFGDRHSYFCAHDAFAPIRPDDVLEARKVFHVSPFQPIDGSYRFRFGLSKSAVSVGIDLRHAAGGLAAGLAGQTRPLTSTAILGVLLKRPLGAFRVLALIHFQALKLWIGGALFHHRPLPPGDEVSR